MSVVDAYLADLGGRLRLREDAAARLLDEVEAHLREAVDHAVADGAPIGRAEHDAVRRFGSARQVAYEANGGWMGALSRWAAVTSRLGAVGCLTVLAGTILATLAAKATSAERVFGLPAAADPGARAISHWLAVQPRTTNWRLAAAWENADDSLVLRGGAALAGIVVCCAAVLLTSRRYRQPNPRWLSLAVAATFALAATMLFLTAATDSALLDWGRGQALADGLAASVAAIAYLLTARRREMAKTP